MSSETIEPKKSALVTRDVIDNIRAKLRGMANETPPPTDRGMSRRKAVQDELMADLKACLKAGWTEAQLVEAMAGVGLQMSPKTLETYVRRKPGKVRKDKVAAGDGTKAATKPKATAETKKPAATADPQSSLPMDMKIDPASGPVTTRKDAL